MKAILMSIKPQYVAKILNKEKTIEVRKKFPKDYVGWFYIYCTKGNKSKYNCNLLRKYDGVYLVDTIDYKTFNQPLNGKVIARFWCDKVEEINPSNLDNFSKDSCLTTQELENYLWSNICCGYAIHITKLEIFDKPKEISEFSVKVFPHRKDNLMTRYLTCAPSNYCYVEVE